MQLRPQLQYLALRFNQLGGLFLGLVGSARIFALVLLLVAAIVLAAVVANRIIIGRPL